VNRAAAQVALYKPVTESGVQEQGEDWSEQLTSILARKLAVPCAEVQMAVRDHRHGQPFKEPSTRTMADATRRGASIGRGPRLSTGLVERERTPRSFIVQHQVCACAQAATARCSASRRVHSLRHTSSGICCLTPGSPIVTGMTRTGLFCSHSIRQHLQGSPRSYDQAGSLGFNLTDSRRLILLGEPGGVERWVQKGTAHRFEHDVGHPKTLVALALESFQLVDVRTRDFWLNRLDQGLGR